jgi:transposase
VKAPVPPPVIKGSFASPEAIAHIAVQKYVMCIPLYRQQQEWKRAGILLSRQTMSNWLLRASRDWLLPVYNALRQLLLKRDVLHADESVLQVLHEDGKTARSQSRMWLYCTGSDARLAIILFEY